MDWFISVSGTDIINISSAITFHSGVQMRKTKGEKLQPCVISMIKINSNVWLIGPPRPLHWHNLNKPKNRTRLKKQRQSPTNRAAQSLHWVCVTKGLLPSAGAPQILPRFVVECPTEKWDWASWSLSASPAITPLNRGTTPLRGSKKRMETHILLLLLHVTALSSCMPYTFTWRQENQQFLCLNH